MRQSFLFPGRVSFQIQALERSAKQNGNMCIAELKAAAIQGGVRNIFTSPFTL